MSAVSAASAAPLIPSDARECRYLFAASNPFSEARRFASVVHIKYIQISPKAVRQQVQLSSPDMTSNHHHATMENTAGEVVPLAVVGMSCRFPGGSNNPEQLWEMLSEGRSGWAQGAGDRFQTAAFYHPAAELGGVVCAFSFPCVPLKALLQ